VRGFSGGERSRLALAKMLLFPRNVLALDEPTNHLDIPARETLEHALDGYDGTLIVVSHDRYFLDRVCRRLLVFENGTLDTHLGNYSDWREYRKRQAAAQPVPEKSANAATRPIVDRSVPRREEGPRAHAAPPGTNGRVAGSGSLANRNRAVDVARGNWLPTTGATGRKLHALADRERELGELLGRRNG